ncbi:MAG: serine/threonine protein kinase, partial [Planctomycetota bacterium]
MNQWTHLFILKIAYQKGVFQKNTLLEAIKASEKEKVTLLNYLIKRFPSFKEVSQAIQEEASKHPSWPSHPQQILKENQRIYLDLKEIKSIPNLEKEFHTAQKLVALGKAVWLHHFIAEKQVISLPELEIMLSIEREGKIYCPQCGYSLTILEYCPWRLYPCLFCSHSLEIKKENPLEKYETRYSSPTEVSSKGEKKQNFHRFQIQKVLGRGGMGTVYLVYDPEIQKDVALKVLNPSVLNPRTHKRFLREIEIVQSLNHPHIISLLDVGQWKGYLFYTMEYVPGGDLRKWIKENGPVTEANALRWGIQISQAIGHAHDKGIIHRDIKPENILLDSFQKPYIMDFGLAKVLNSSE